MKSLEDALKMSQAAIEAGLLDARAELEALHERQVNLEALIARAELALGQKALDLDGAGAGDGDLTLHVALERILRDNGNRWMNVRELSDEVNRRGLYRKRDGSLLEPSQVHARTKNYDDVFEKNGSLVRLRVAPNEWDVAVFKDDDDGFFAWQDAHPNGYFINTERKPNPNYLVLHESGCGHFKGSPPTVRWTKDYIKIASESREELNGWAKDIVGGEVTLCGSCFGRG